MASPAEAHSRRQVLGDVWERLAWCESRNTNNGGAPYYGYYQFDKKTWQSVGGEGMPNEFSKEKQTELAKKLQAKRGWKPWPGCSRKLRLNQRG